MPTHEIVPATRKVVIHLPDGRGTEVMRFSLEAPDEHVLRAYVEEGFVLERTVVPWGGIKATLSISWKQGEPLHVSGEVPDPERRAVLLHRLRPFLLVNEPFEFHKVRGIIARAVEGEWAQNRLRQLKQLYTGRYRQSQFRVVVNDELVNSERVLDAWLNGYEYHRDAEKAAIVDAVHRTLPIDGTQPLFMALLADKLRAVLLLGQLANQMISAPPDSDATEA